MLSSRLMPWGLVVAAGLSSSPSAFAQLCGGELCPGRIWDPAGLQYFQDATYNPDTDQYLLVTSTYAGETGQPLAALLNTDGSIVPATIEIDIAGAANAVVTEYSPEHASFLAVWRNANETLQARHLGSDGTPISSVFNIGLGDPPSIAYSKHSQRYLVTYSRRISGLYWTFYAMIDANPSSGAPLLASGTIDSNGLSAQVAYNNTSQKFLVVFVKDFAPAANQADLYGCIVSSVGVMGTPYAIDTSFENQQMPLMAASDSGFGIIYEDWEDVSTHSAGVSAIQLDANGVAIRQVYVAQTSAWDTPGALTYNSTTNSYVAAWRAAYSNTNLQHKLREFSAVDLAPIGSEVTISPQDSSILSAAARPVASDPQALILWAYQVGEDGVHAGIHHLPPVITTQLAIEGPANGSAKLQPFTISGWALDSAAPTGTGVDEVHVWAFPEGGGQTFLGAATYGISRPDVGTYFGDVRFDPSGYSLSVAVALPTGNHTLRVYAKSTLTEVFDGIKEISVWVGPSPQMVIDLPTTTSSLPFSISGWAIDRSWTADHGVDEVHIWAYRTDNLVATFLGVATSDVSRPDLASYFGAQFALAGWELDVLTPLPATTYHIVAYAKSTSSGVFDNQAVVTIGVLPPVSTPAMAIDTPTNGTVVVAGSAFPVGGWAADLGAICGPCHTGVDEIHVWAFPVGGGAPVFLGVPSYGESRPDVGTVFGDRFSNSGYLMTTSLPAGTYDISVYAHSTIANAFNNVRGVRVVSE
jgi:hypothetical protein